MFLYPFHHISHPYGCCNLQSPAKLELEAQQMEAAWSQHTLTHFPKDTGQVHPTQPSCDLPSSSMSSYNLSVFLRQKTQVRICATHGWLM